MSTYNLGYVYPLLHCIGNPNSTAVLATTFQVQKGDGFHTSSAGIEHRPGGFLTSPMGSRIAGGYSGTRWIGSNRREATAPHRSDEPARSVNTGPDMPNSTGYGPAGISFCPPLENIFNT